MYEIVYRAAVHECGHAFVAAACPHVVAVLEVMVDPILGGRTTVAYAADRQRGFPLHDAAIALGGIAAETEMFGDAYPGLSSGDDVTRALVASLRANALGRRAESWPVGEGFIGAALWSYETDEDTRGIVRRCFGRARAVVRDHVSPIRDLAAALAQDGTVRAGHALLPDVGRYVLR